jgi:hypothetical protein
MEDQLNSESGPPRRTHRALDDAEPHATLGRDAVIGMNV